MKYIIRPLVALMLAFAPLQDLLGQDALLSGRVVTADGTGLGYANVELATGDSIVAGAISDSSGYFQVAVSPGTYTLTTKTWGYDSFVGTVDIQSDKDVGELPMKISGDITEVEIRARKPLVIREIDRIRVNVSNTILADGDAWEMLRLAPGVMVSQKGDIRINGKSNILVMIDGREVFLSGQDLMDMLTGMSASEVASVEIISNPPASFSASGSGIVNIIMKKDSREGLRGNLRSRFTRGINNRMTNGLNMTFKRKKLYLNGSYDLNFGKRFSEERSNIRFNSPTEGISFWNEVNELNGRYMKHGYHLYADYALSEKAVLSFRTDGSVTPYNGTDNFGLTNIYGADGLPDSSIVNENEALNKGNFQSYFLGYKQEMDKGYWQLHADYTKFSSQLSQDIFSEFRNTGGLSLGRSDFLFDSDQDVNIFGGQFDISRPLDKIGSLDAGVKFSTIRTDNGLEHYDLVDGLAIRNETRSNDFVYDEQNAAAYLSWRKNWQDFSIKAGLRSEFTNLDGRSLTDGQSIDNQYLRWFPSLHLQYVPSEKNIWGLTYGTRINRPSYRFLNVFRMYSSPYSYIEGNPFLQPAIVRNLELSLVHDNNYFFSLFASHTDNAITQISLQDNEENTLKFFALNQDVAVRAGASTNGSLDLFEWWSVYWDVSGYWQYNAFTAPDNGSEVANTAFAVEPFLWTGFYPGRLDGLSIEFQFSYYSPRLQGSFRVDSRSELAFGLKKKFFNDRLAASFFLADLFDDNKFVLRSRYSEQDHLYREDPENQYFRFGLNWKFGNQKVKSKKEQKSNTEEKQRL